MILAHANLVGDGISAFRQKDFARSIDLLSKAIDKDKNDWQARMYLAMSYYATGNIYLGAVHFRYLKDNCPIAEVRGKAESALAMMDSELKLTSKDPDKPREPHK